MSDQAFVSAEEFRDGGYLQEINRLLLHPLGLAMEMDAPKLGEIATLRVQDHRSSRGGVLYAEEMDLTVKAGAFLKAFSSVIVARMETHGWVVQPVADRELSEGDDLCIGCGQPIPDDMPEVRTDG